MYNNNAIYDLIIIDREYVCLYYVRTVGSSQLNLFEIHPTVTLSTNNRLRTIVESFLRLSKVTK